MAGSKDQLPPGKKTWWKSVKSASKATSETTAEHDDRDGGRRAGAGDDPPGRPPALLAGAGDEAADAEQRDRSGDEAEPEQQPGVGQVTAFGGVVEGARAGPLGAIEGEGARTQDQLRHRQVGPSMGDAGLHAQLLSRAGRVQGRVGEEPASAAAGPPWR